jgi:hypothetical protein
MKLGPRIRFGLVAVTLLAQLALPVARDLRVATGDHPLLASRSAATIELLLGGSRNALEGHDPSVCPTCLALSQARSGIGRTLPAGFLQLISAVTAPGHEPRLVLPRTPDLGTAPPRAPPIRSLSFA